MNLKKLEYFSEIALHLIETSSNTKVGVIAFLFNTDYVYPFDAGLVETKLDESRFLGAIASICQSDDIGAFIYLTDSNIEGYDDDHLLVRIQSASDVKYKTYKIHRDLSGYIKAFIEVDPEVVSSSLSESLFMLPNLFAIDSSLDDPFLDKIIPSVRKSAIESRSLHSEFFKINHSELN